MTTFQEDRADLMILAALADAIRRSYAEIVVAVAWTNDHNTMQILSRWPGTENMESKVPTKLVYDPNNEVVKWGFLCENDIGENSSDAKEGFKIYLDQTNIDRVSESGVADVPSVEEARRWTTDYLRQLYRHIKCSIESATGSWMEKKVCFLFGIPGTWTAMGITAGFNNIIREAGFGVENPAIHTVKLVNEIQAIATRVAASPAVKLEKGDVILVCDAGGTIDFGLLEVIDATSEMPEFRDVGAVQSIWVESMIDHAFQNTIQKRLDENPDACSRLPNNLALKIAQSINFQIVKHGLGRAEFEMPEYRFALDGLRLGISRNFNHPKLKIEKGRMIFSRAEMQLLFDPLVDKTVQKIDEQLEWMQSKNPTQSVKYIILSGEICASPYLNTKLEQRYTHVSKPITILRSEEPKLSLVKGLISVQKLIAEAAAVLRARTSRASYGIVCRQRYNPKIHVQDDIEPETDRTPKWAKEQIEWLIKTGDDIGTDFAVEKSISRKIDPSYPGRKLDTLIMMSHNPRGTLPKSLKDNGAQKLCSWDFPFDEVEASNSRPNSRHFWQRKPDFYEIILTVKAIPGPADLKFELWFKGRRRESLTLQVDPWVERGQAGVSGRRYASDNNWDRYVGGRSGRS